jgi:hypothetical protein
MREHGCGKPRVVNLNTGDAILHDKPSPLSIDRGTVWQQFHSGLDERNFAVGVLNCQSKPISLWRPGHRISEFGDVLMSVIKNCALDRQIRERTVYRRVMRIGTPGDTQQNIRIYEAGVNRHLLRILIKALSREGLIGKLRNLV